MIGEVELSDDDLAFLRKNTAAAMITVGSDGMPKTARVAAMMIDGKLWSSGTKDRVRTERLRSDPRCVLYVHDAGYGWLTLETTVRLLEGPQVPALTVQLFRRMQGRPVGPLSWFGDELEEAEFTQRLIDEGRLIYEFEIHKAYGMH